GEDAPARLGDAIVAAAPLSCLLDPSPFDPAALLEAVERGVERRQGEAQAAAGAGLDQLGDRVTVAALVLDDRQDDDLGAAFLGFVERSACRHVQLPYIVDSYIYTHWTRR